MADLLSEVQQQQQQQQRHIMNASAWRGWRSSSALPGAGDSCGCPLLADEVYSTAVASPAQPSPAAEVGRVPAASQQATTPTWSNAGSCNKGPAASGAAAAIAGCRRQFLGLNGPPSTSAAAVVPAMKRSYTSKSRPEGMSCGFGPGHVPGLLPRPQSSQEQAGVLNLPARPGVCVALARTRLQPRSCCPPSASEPLSEVDPQAASLIAQRQAQRMLEQQLLINRLVYDSLEPGPDQLGAATPGSCAGSSSPGSSCRTTGSGFTSRSNSTVGEEACCGAATPPDAGCGQAQQPDTAAAAHAYAAGLQPWYSPQSAADSTLIFESRFESGNLRRAVQVDDWEYDLVLQPDFNTKGHTQFFFFAVANTRAGRPYRFNIINLQKEDSLYGMGMLPLMHSEQEMHRKGVGWVRRGSEVGYGPNGIRRGKQGTYHTLTFVVEFPWDDDLVHLAHCYPLTFTDLQNHLHMLLKEPCGALMQRSTLATSLAGNTVDLLTITAPSGMGKPMSQRQGVVLSARVHPGETNSSWMMKGALQQLLASTAEAAQLREAFVFKVVPMLNPDGVIVGNYRCSLAGFDLNRVWQEPDARLQPTIAAYKAMIAGFADEREVVLMCDMHGHSRKYGIFMYGCQRTPKNAAPANSSSSSTGGVVPGSLGGLPGVPVRVQERLFPLMLGINAPDLFTFKGCNFKVQRSKAGTGRVVGWRELGLVNSFTIEASFCGPVLSGSRFSRQHFNTGHLEDMGSALVRTLLDYWAPAELSSAAELASHLASSSSSSVGPLAGVLDLGGAGDGDDDACTDSDDESSDEEEPAPAAACATREQGGLGRPVGGRTQGEAAGVAAVGVQNSAAAAAAVAATARSTVAHLSGQLAAMLRTGIAAAAEQNKGAASAASGPAAVFAAAAAADTGCGAGLGALLSSLTARLAAASGPPGSSNSKSSQDSAGSLAATVPVAAAAKAAQELLTRLAAAKAKLPPAGTAAAAAAAAAAATAVAPAGAAGDKLCAPGLSPAPAATSVCSISCAASTGAGIPAVACWPHAAVGSAAEQGAAVAVAAASPVAAGGVAATPGRAKEAFPGTTDMPAGVGSDDTALAAMPGLIDILQQLVAQFAVLDGAAAAAAAAASGGPAAKGPKSKGRRRGLARYGNPEVLRAARARADAGLAAALPELGRSLLGLNLAQPPSCDADGSGGVLCCSSSPLAAAESPPGTGPQIMSGRRAGAPAGPKAGAGCVLDACRYLELLDKQKQHTGGVLATSSIDNPWGAAAVQQPAVAPAAPGRPQLADPRAGFEGSGGGGGGSRRRSKSAHAWLQCSFRQRLSDTDAEAVNSR